MAVIVREGRLLVIRRSLSVRAPGAYCFPGGGIEPDETEEQAVVRELREELSVAIRPLTRLWQSVTPWGVHLAWWHAELSDLSPLRPDPAEVAEALWLTTAEMRALPELLASNRDFLDAHAAGAFSLAGLDR